MLVKIPQRKSEATVIGHDKRPRATTIEALTELPTQFLRNGTVTAGNA